MDRCSGMARCAGSVVLYTAACQPVYVPPLPLKKRRAGTERLALNVGGTRFEIWRHLLERYPDTLLGSDEKDYFFDDGKREYFFDRDPDLFRYILSFYRTGRLHYPESESVSAYDEELHFFGIPNDADAIGPCCREAYIDKKEAHEASVSAAAKEAQVPPEPVTFREKIWRIVENPDETTLGLVFFYVTGFFIAVSVFANVVETLNCAPFPPKMKEQIPCGIRYALSFSCLETACVVIFTAEYLIRLFAAPERGMFVKSAMSVIDIVSILPFYVGLCIPANNSVNGLFVTLRVFRVFRIFKLSRSSPGLRLLGDTLKGCARDLGFLLFALSMAVIIFATMVFYAERNHPNSYFSSIPEGFWYIIVTMTTLGYGDMTPRTIPGKLVTAFCSITSVILLTLPLTVIVSNFTNVIQSKKGGDKGRHLVRGTRPTYEEREFLLQRDHLMHCLETTTESQVTENNCHMGYMDNWAPDLAVKKAQ
ncbi:PREDICTED: potassium voltage-gated channel protein Shal-like [Branchiostoma belcheri]|uniref:Potassium voltage-gated channel protein Shal-like n=1 Tax=Branchiostoma belcheri TaxID=7741 RepID=A0A6P4ZXE4_BRABE|nr:PREDICTED: potassium voltage-gated channel protein Shal-like [Branchiostoma belcheri]